MSADDASEKPQSKLLLLRTSNHTIPADLDALLSGCDPDAVRSSSAVVFKTTAPLHSELLSGSDPDSLEMLAKRAGSKPVFVISYDRQEQAHRLDRIEANQLVRVDQEDLISEIRVLDLSSILEQAGDTCYLRSTGSYHFLSPSERHCSVFIRVGDAVRSVSVLDDVAFWILPKLVNAEAVLVDSWTIASIVIRGLHRLGKDIPFECLSSHPKYESRSAAAAIDRLLTPLGAQPRILCVISLSSTGSFMQFVEKSVAAVNRPLDLSVVSLYGFPGAPPGSTVLCELPDDVGNYQSPEDCPMCQQGSKPIPVDPRVYYVKEHEEREIALSLGYFDAARDVLAKYSAIPGALRLHRDDPSDGSTKHHAFNIDVLSVVTEEGYQKRYLDFLRSVFPSPEIVIAPDHDAGKALANIAGEALSARVIVHNSLQGELSEQDVSSLKAAENILIVDDVLNTGTRLQTFNRSLRERFGQIKNLSFFVVLARPEAPAIVKRVRAALTKGHHWNSSLMALDTLYLPRLSTQFCPWCREFEFLSLASEQLAEPPGWITSRLSRLAGTVAGLTREPLLLLPGVQEPKLAPQSGIAKEGTDALAIQFAFASALQLMRHDESEQKRLHSGPILSNILATRSLTTNYDEALLQATMLRQVSRSEWGEGGRMALGGALREITQQPGKEILLGEVLLAQSRGCLPSYGQQTFKKLFGPRLEKLTEIFHRNLATAPNAYHL